MTLTFLFYSGNEGGRSRSRFIRAAVITDAAPIILFQRIKDSGGNYYDYDENGACKARHAFMESS